MSTYLQRDIPVTEMGQAGTFLSVCLKFHVSVSNQGAILKSEGKTQGHSRQDTLLATETSLWYTQCLITLKFSDRPISLTLVPQLGFSFCIFDIFFIKGPNEFLSRLWELTWSFVLLRCGTTACKRDAAVCLKRLFKVLSRRGNTWVSRFCFFLYSVGYCVDWLWGHAPVTRWPAF